MVQRVISHLGHTSLRVSDRPVAMHMRMQPVWQALQHHSIVGLYGMGGIGKTSLANAIYNQLQHDFVNCCCYVKVGSMSKDAAMRVPLIERRQEQMLQELCGLYGHFHGVDQNSCQLQRSLSSRQVLLVLDDVWSEDQLEHLLVTVAPGSKVIVTSRNHGLLQQYLPTLGMPFMCVEVELLPGSDSLALLCLHAFGRPDAPPKLAGIAARVAATCNGLGLALRVTGSFLKIHRDPQIWEDVCYRLQSAQSLDGQENGILFASLRVSYDNLSCTLQDMLMDVACILLGRTVAAAVCAWGQAGKLGLETLRNLSLVTVNGGVLGMHDQMRDMLRSQVVQDTPGRHHYAWDQQAADTCRSSKPQQVGCCLRPHMSFGPESVSHHFVARA